MDTSPYDRWILIEPMNSGEQEVKDYLRANGYTVADVSDIAFYQRIDVDILAYKDNLNDEVKIEVKNDGMISNTGNLFIELITDLDKSRLGWFNITGADYIYYRDRVNKQVYILPLNNLKDFIESHKSNLELRCANDYRKDGTISKVSSGYLIPIRDYLSDYPNTEIIHI